MKQLSVSTFLTVVLIVTYLYSPSLFANTDGRLLASQCAQCHGTDGKSSTNIDSLEADEIIEELREYKASSDSDDIMVKQAHGYTDAEIALIATYLSSISSGGGSGDGDDDSNDDDDDDDDDDDNDRDDD